MDNYRTVPIKRSKKKKKNKKTVIFVLLAFAVIVSVISLIVHFSGKLTNDSYKNCSLGDVNGDGYITSADALCVINHISGKGELFDNQIIHSDVNQDSVVDSKDVLILLKVSVGEITKIPYIADANEGQEVKSADITDGNICANVQIINEWQNADGTYSYQLNFTASNSGSMSVQDYKLFVNTSNEVTVSDSWDCNCSANGNSIEVTIPDIPISSAAACGIIVKGEQGLTINNLETEK